MTEQFEPLGGAYYDGELILQPTHYLTTAERLEMLETHPFLLESVRSVERRLGAKGWCIMIARSVDLKMI